MERIIVICLLFLTGCEKAANPDINIPIRSFENRVGTVFTPLPDDIFKAPSIAEIQLPQRDSIDAIWGATGRDDDGYIYIGTSSHDGSYGSSFLYQYHPSTGAIVPQSDQPV